MAALFASLFDVGLGVGTMLWRLSVSQPGSCLKDMEAKRWMRCPEDGDTNAIKA